MKRSLLCTLLGLLLAAGAAHAEEAWPTRPVTMVLPYAVGGGADLMARSLADSMRKTLGQPVTVQNVAGAGSVLGTRQVVNAAPDGYTVLMNHMGLATTPALYKNLQFDPVRSLEPIGLYAEIPMLVVAGKDFPASNARELIEHVRKHKDKVTMATSGMGSGTHLCAILFEKALGQKLTIVQYKGSAPAYMDIQSGRVDLMCDSTGGSVAQVRGGGVKAFVVTGAKRITSLPQVPTATEAGLSELAAMTVWYGVFAPRGTPKAVVDRLSSAMQVAVRDPEVGRLITSWDATLYDPKQAVPAAMRERMASQVELWTRTLHEAGLTPQ